MIMTLVGRKKYSFTSEQGQLYEGDSLYVNYVAEGVLGMMADKLSVRNTIPLPDGLVPGSEIDVSFDMRGKPISVTLAKAAKAAGFPAK